MKSTDLFFFFFEEIYEETRRYDLFIGRPETETQKNKEISLVAEKKMFILNNESFSERSERYLYRLMAWHI